MKPDDSAVEPLGCCIALQHHAVDAGVVQHQRRREPAGAGADDRDGGLRLGVDPRRALHAAQRRIRLLRHASRCTKSAQSITSATLRMSASEVWCRSSPKAAQPSASTSVR